jgi:tRNA nucleotidyltransferase (CCA-adding enzyme)
MYAAWILAALTPWSMVPQTMSIKSKGKPSIIIGAAVAREGIKAETKMCNIIGGAFKNWEQIKSLKDAIVREDAYTKERDTVGMTIRGWDAQGGHWRLQALFALLVEVMTRSQPTKSEGKFCLFEVRYITKSNSSRRATCRMAGIYRSFGVNGDNGCSK